MSYIINSTNPFVSVKLTEKGREQLALGRLNFSFWAVGDSEINYDREAIVDANPLDVTLSATSKVLRPVDRQPNIKYFIYPSISTSPYQSMTNANMNVVKAVVNNEAVERGFFDNQLTAFTTNLSSDLTPYQETISNTFLSGGTILTVTGTSITVGNLVLLKPSNSVLGNVVMSSTTEAIPNLWFQVQSVSGNQLTVDRNLPVLSGVGNSTNIIVYRQGEVYDTISTGNTTAYWDSGTLSFNSNVNITCHDVPVWNMNNVWCENMAGMTADTAYEDYTKFGSYPYLGTKAPYLEYWCESTGSTSYNCNGPGISYPDDVHKSISIIHYTNNAISNLYGEFFYVDATNNKYVQVHTPNLMYHRAGYTTGTGTEMGMTFIASGDIQTIGSSEIQYIDLIEHPDYISSANTTPLVVGKVLPQYKMVIIDNEEIVAAMSYKANRNWTLPELAANIIPPSGSTTSGVLGVNETIYLTYILDNSGSTTGLTSSLPCQNYVKVTNTTASSKDIAFRINETDLLPYMRKIEDVSYDGYGWYAHNFKLLYQVVSGDTVRPDPSAWLLYNYTTTGLTGTAGATIDPLALENQTPGSQDCGVTTGFVLNDQIYSASTLFNLYPLLNMAPTNQPTYLQFGDERFFYGNIETYIGATIYKTIFDLSVNGSQFDITTNPTRSTDSNTNPANLRITDVGIYDNAYNLVCIGKLSKPVILQSNNTIMLELSMDF